MRIQQELGMEAYVGIDIHKKSGTVCIQDELGRIREEFDIENNREGIEFLLASLRGYNDIYAAIESTGNLWIPLYDALAANGVNTSLIHPYKTRLIAESKIKNDKLDARTITTLLRGDFLFKCYVPPKNIRDERDIVRLRASLVKMRTEIKNRVHSILDKNGIKLEWSDIFGTHGLRALETLELSGSDKIALSSYLTVYKALTSEIEQVSNHIASMSDDDIELLMSIPGINYYSAKLIMSEIGAIGRFSSHNKLAAWIGLNPRVHQSGNVSWTGSITKQGSKRLRWILVQCAHKSIHGSPQLYEFYERIKHKKGSNKAIVAVARKLVKIIYTVLTKRETSHYGNPTKTETKINAMKKKAQPYEPHLDMSKEEMLRRCLEEED